MSLSDQELDHRLNALDRSCESPEQVWQKLKPQLDAPPAHRLRRPWLALAAAVAGMTLVSALLLLPTRLPWDSTLVDLPAPDTVSEIIEPATGLQRSRQSLAAAAAENESAIRKLKAVLEQEPDNLLLMEFLAEARFRQAELMSMAARLDIDTNTP